MPSHDSDRFQEFHSRIGALHIALNECLAALAVLYGDEARRKIELMRDKLIHEFKQSGIPAEREMDHAKIVRPAIEVIETVFDGFLRNLPKNDIC